MEQKQAQNTSRTGIYPQLAAMEDYDPDSMPVEQARVFIRQFLEPVAETETVALHDAFQRTLAADVPAPTNVPPHDYSAMDGYALRHAELHKDAILQVAGEALAGHPFAGALPAGACVRIMTGALIPQGCDTVVMQEDVERRGAGVSVSGLHQAGQNIRRIGEDLRQGEAALARGKAVHAAEMGLLASLGLNRALVFRKLRVAIFSTGDELLQPGMPPQPGRIYDSNRHTLSGMLREMGGVEVRDLGSIRDNRDSIRAALLDAASRADVVISSGGVSVGEADYIKALLQEIGEVVFWKIAMKPGRPLAYGKIGKSHFFGLPGNPVAVMVTFRQFVADALHILMGQQPVPALTFQVACSETIRKKPGRTEFQRGILARDGSGSLSVRTTGEQGSGILSSMSRANCFIILPMEEGTVNAGSLVEVQLF